MKIFSPETCVLLALMLSDQVLATVPRPPRLSQIPYAKGQPFIKFPNDRDHLLLGPSVTINSPPAKIIGIPPQPTAIFTEEFPGIPFAKAPVGPLRLKPPQPLTEPLGVLKLMGNGPACPQLFFDVTQTDGIQGLLGALSTNPFFRKATSQSEDCLYLNVHRPRGTKAGAKLPVLYWIFGGGFELGFNYMYPGAPWVEESLRLGEPIIVVTVNYRVGGFGFLGGKELKKDGSTNLGLLDQRLGLQWVADNIAAFGGDPDKVTIWGESAGAISVYDHLLAYNGDHTYKGKPLFRGAIMNSGSIIPADNVDTSKPQAIYDTVVRVSGCSGDPNTLECLRRLSFDDFYYATANVPGIFSYRGLALSYLPRPDGTFLTDNPAILALDGKVAKVPFIIGDQEDEGTLFALFQSNITTTDQLVDYLGFYFKDLGIEKIKQLVGIYSDPVEYASPFRTAPNDGLWYPQYKRLAAILGDLTFTLTRRTMLLIAAGGYANKIPSWSYLSSYNYGFPILGTTHATDLIHVFFGITNNYATRAFRQYYIHFTNTLNPNKPGTNIAYWETWVEKQRLLNMFNDNSGYVNDTFRQPMVDFLIENIGSLKI